MPKFEFVGLGTGGDRHQLIAETDSECWNFFLQRFAHEFVGFGDEHRISGTVGEKYAVEFWSFIEEVVIPWNANDADSAVQEIFNGIIFDAAVDENDRLFAACFIGFWRFCRNLRDEIDFVGIEKFSGVFLVNHDFPEHSTVGA